MCDYKYHGCDGGALYYDQMDSKVCYSCMKTELDNEDAQPSDFEAIAALPSPKCSCGGGECISCYHQHIDETPEILHCNCMLPQCGTCQYWLTTPFGDQFIKTMAHHNLKSIEFLKTLSTPRLLVYFKKYRYFRHVGMCGCGCGEPMSAITDVDKDTAIYFNDCLKYVEQMKRILDERENVE